MVLEWIKTSNWSNIKIEIRFTNQGKTSTNKIIQF